MNDFVVDVIKSILKNTRKITLDRIQLLGNVKIDLQEDIEEYELNPIIDKLLQLNLINEMDTGILILTEEGEGLISEPDIVIDSVWSSQNSKDDLEKIQLKKSSFVIKHYEVTSALERSYNEYLVHLKKYLKSLLINMNPYEFESLVIEILLETNEAPYGEVTKKSGDGGIDGLLYRTFLKQGEIPVQMKRYAENNLVGEQEIRDFIGSWSQKHNNGAYFVTTSDYTNKARMKGEARGLILIDGNQLVELMIDNRIGLKRVNNLQFCFTPSLKRFE